MLSLRRFLSPYSALVWLIVVLVLGQTLADLYLPTMMSLIVDRGIVLGDVPVIIRIGSRMLLVAALGVGVSVAASLFSSRVGTAVGRDLRSRLFARTQGFSVQDFDRFGTATLITRTTNDITQVQQVLVTVLRMMVGAPLMAAGGIFMAVSKDPGLSLIIVLVVPILAAGIALVASKALPLFRAIQAKLDNLNLVAREALTGIRVVRAFNRTAYEEERFRSVNADLTAITLRVGRIMAGVMPLMMILLNLTIIGVIWFGALRIEGGHMQVGDLMAFIQYVMQIMFSLLMVSMMLMMIPRAAAAATRISEVLAVPAEFTVVAGAAGADADGTAAAGPPEVAPAPPDDVEFRNVSFSYPGAERPAIQNVSFSAGPGEVTAVIGSIGSGKTTLVNLIPRFFDPDAGAVLVGGVDVRAWPPTALREKVGFVPQSAVLFTGSVADNIRFGKPDATAAEVEHAARVAQAFEFIAEMPNGFESEISQGGRNLSGGQKQRLTIARALVRRPEIYIFDDNFSALDYKTDAALRRALRRETAAATVIIIAQRVSTIRDADRIVVLDRGTVAGVGSHDELLESCPVYREIVASQTQEEAVA